MYTERSLSYIGQPFFRAGFNAGRIRDGSVGVRCAMCDVRSPKHRDLGESVKAAGQRAVYPKIGRSWVRIPPPPARLRRFFSPTDFEFAWN